MEDQKQKNEEKNNTFFSELNNDFLKYELFNQYLNFMFPELLLICPSFDRLKKQIEYKNSPDNNICFLNSFLEECVDIMIYIKKQNIILSKDKLIAGSTGYKLSKIIDYMMKGGNEISFPFLNKDYGVSILTYIRCPVYILFVFLFLYVKIAPSTKSTFFFNYHDDASICINMKPAIICGIILNDLELLDVLNKGYHKDLKENALFLKCCLEADEIMKKKYTDGIQTFYNPPIKVWKWGMKNLDIGEQRTEIIKKDYLLFYKYLFEEQEKNDINHNNKNDEKKTIKISNDLLLTGDYNAIKIFKYLVFEKGYKVRKRELKGICKEYMMEQKDYTKYLENSDSSSSSSSEDDISWSSTDHDLDREYNEMIREEE